MKRDMDLFRQLLIEVEKLPGNDWTQIDIAGRSTEEITYHAKLADDAGFIEAKFAPRNICSNFVLIKRLTYAGHEFLDAARSDKVWAQAKDRVLQATGTLTVETLKMALSAIMKQLLGV